MACRKLTLAYLLFLDLDSCCQLAYKTSPNRMPQKYTLASHRKMGCLKLSFRRGRGVLKVVKVDGEVVELTSPVAVKELLVNFEGFGVKSSRKSSKPLSPSFELRLGKIYYLFPSIPSDPAKNETDEGASFTTAVKRIKVVITRKQLEELLSKKASVEKIILGIDKAWKPSLVAIPEENELI